MRLIVPCPLPQAHEQLFPAPWRSQMCYLHFTGPKEKWWASVSLINPQITSFSVNTKDSWDGQMSRSLRAALVLKYRCSYSTASGLHHIEDISDQEPLPPPCPPPSSSEFQALSLCNISLWRPWSKLEYNAKLWLQRRGICIQKHIIPA